MTGQIGQVHILFVIVTIVVITISFAWIYKYTKKLLLRPLLLRYSISTIFLLGFIAWHCFRVYFKWGGEDLAMYLEMAFIAMANIAFLLAAVKTVKLAKDYRF
ncbi:MAG: hypothetical protein HY929_01300 [Euryarchaeota archaeon]|nr:hypothetical protein [Euryarchaeota archaeon]